MGSHLTTRAAHSTCIARPDRNHPPCNPTHRSRRRPRRLPIDTGTWDHHRCKRRPQSYRHYRLCSPWQNRRSFVREHHRWGRLTDHRAGRYRPMYNNLRRCKGSREAGVRIADLTPHRRSRFHRGLPQTRGRGRRCTLPARRTDPLACKRHHPSRARRPVRWPRRCHPLGKCAWCTGCHPDKHHRTSNPSKVRQARHPVPHTPKKELGRTIPSTESARSADVYYEPPSQVPLKLWDLECHRGRSKKNATRDLFGNWGDSRGRIRAVMVFNVFEPSKLLTLSLKGPGGRRGFQPSTGGVFATELVTQLLRYRVEPEKRPVGNLAPRAGSSLGARGCLNPPRQRGLPEHWPSEPIHRDIQSHRSIQWVDS